MKRAALVLLILFTVPAFLMLVVAQDIDPSDYADVEASINPALQFVRVNADPGDDAPVNEALFPGVIIILTGDAEVVGEMRWWQILPPSGIEGWVAEVTDGQPTLVLADGTSLGSDATAVPPQPTAAANLPMSETQIVAVDLLLIYAQPDAESDILEAVSQDVELRILDAAAEPGWAQVESPSELVGWVETTVDGLPTLMSGAAASGELAVGGAGVIVSAGLALLYDEADDERQVIEALSDGVTLQIIGGPEVVSAVDWWQVRSPSGIEGWLPESVDGEVVLLSPAALAAMTPTPQPTPLPTATPIPVFTSIAVGAEVQVQSLEPAFPLRASPSIRGAVIVNLPRSERATVIAGPESVSETTDRGVAADFTWWQIRTTDGREGWLPEDAYGEPVLILYNANTPLVPVTCTLSTIRDINIRSGPGTQYEQIASRAGEGQLLAAEGQFGDINVPEAHWWRLAEGFWVRNDQVREQPREACALLPGVRSP